MTELEFRILGPLEVLAAGRPIPLRGPNQRALLALLALRANKTVKTKLLVDQLWGEHPPRTATTSLRNTVSQLRKLLGANVLLTRPSGYTLVLNKAQQLDVTRFEDLVRRAHATDASDRLVVPDDLYRHLRERAALLREALDLWRGPALADLERANFAQAEVNRLNYLRLGAFQERIAAELELGKDAELVTEIEAWVRLHPLNDRLRTQLMLALYRSGRHAEALSAYHEARRTFVHELGIEPGPELQHLSASILRQERSLAPELAVDDHYDEEMPAFAADDSTSVIEDVGGYDTGPGAPVTALTPRTVAKLFDDWAFRLSRGEWPNPRDYVERAGDNAAELSGLMDRYLRALPRPSPASEDIDRAQAWLAKTAQKDAP
jgi:DNA-binding SARP family transcriptional activator